MKLSLFLPLLYLACFSELCVLAQQSSSPLNIAQPPGGELTPEQLQAIAKDIRNLEARPFAPDAKQARAQLFKWISGSPDIHVQICADVIGPLLESDSKFKEVLLMQYILSAAAYAIEHPHQVENQAAITTGGLSGALNTYSIVKESGETSAENDFMERMAELVNSAGLRAYVDEGIQQCQ